MAALALVASFLAAATPLQAAAAAAAREVGDDGCERALAAAGCVPPRSVATCDICAGDHQRALRAAGCSDAAVRGWCGGGGGRSFYVSAASGDDSADGTSPATAWLTLAAAGLRLAEGDTLLLQRGDAWLDETLSAAADHLTVKSYGAATLPAPLIQHGRGLNSEAPCAAFADADGLAVSDLHLSGCAGGLSIQPPSGANATGVMLERLFAADIRTPMLVYSPPNPAWAAAIVLAGGAFENLTVRNCVGVRIDVFFRSQARVVGMHLDSNTVQSCSGNCFALGLGVGLVLENSVFLRDFSDRLFMYGVTDIIVGGMSGKNMVRNTDFNQRGEYQGGPDGCAFDFETSAEAFQVVGNMFYRSWGAVSIDTLSI